MNVNEIDELISELNNYNPDKEKQTLIKREAIKGLMGYGKEAERAIVDLYVLNFNTKDAEEKKMSEEAINVINEEWYKDEEILNEVLNFLEVKLKNEDYSISNKAISKFVEIGEPAIEFLISILESKEKNDSIKSRTIKILSRIKSESWKYVETLNKILRDSDNPIIIDFALDTLYELNANFDNKVDILSKCINDKRGEIRLKAIKCIGKLNDKFEDGLKFLILNLSNNDDSIRKEVINVLSLNKSPLILKHILEIAKNKNLFIKEDFQKLRNKLEAFSHNGEFQEWVYKYKVDNNRFFKEYELGKILEGPINLLKSSLEILINLNYNDPQITRSIIDIIDIHSKDETIINLCIELLSNISEDRDIIIPILLKQLKVSSGKAKYKCLQALSKLDKNWYKREDSIDFIKSLIEDFGNLSRESSDNSVEIITTLGEIAIPYLFEGFENNSKRKVQENIVNLLSRYKDNKEITAASLNKLREACNHVYIIQNINDLIKQKENINN